MILLLKCYAKTSVRWIVV